MKPVLMIHEVYEEIFNLPLEDYILTFDDGLYTQYQYTDRFAALNTEKIYFISSNIVCSDTQSTDFITCSLAHNKVFESGNRENYMTLEQIRELSKLPRVTIGGHSHNHVNMVSYSLSAKVQHIRQDTIDMIAWFEKNLDRRPEHFCFPYNNGLGGLYGALLKEYGIIYTYGSERIAVETLLKSA